MLTVLGVYWLKDFIGVRTLLGNFFIYHRHVVVAVIIVISLLSYPWHLNQKHLSYHQHSVETTALSGTTGLADKAQ